MKKQSSIKSFGILFFFVFLIVGLWPLLNDNEIRIAKKRLLEQAEAEEEEPVDV